MSWSGVLPGLEKRRALIKRETGQHTLHQLRRSSAQSPGKLFKRHLLQTATQDAAEVHLIKDQQVFKLERVDKRCLHLYLYGKIFAIFSPITNWQRVVKTILPSFARVRSPRHSHTNRIRDVARKNVSRFFRATSLIRLEKGGMLQD
jgi:hypothetical protein